MTFAWSFVFSFRTFNRSVVMIPPTAVTKAAITTSTSNPSLLSQPSLHPLRCLITSNITKMPRFARDNLPREPKRHSVLLQPFKPFTVGVSNINGDAEIMLRLTRCRQNRHTLLEIPGLTFVDLRLLIRNNIGCVPLIEAILLNLKTAICVRLASRRQVNSFSVRSSIHRLIRISSALMQLAFTFNRTKQLRWQLARHSVLQTRAKNNRDDGEVSTLLQGGHYLALPNASARRSSAASNRRARPSRP